MKHGKASNVFIQFSELDEHFFIGIEDDGIGFQPENSTSGLGLKHMNVRAKFINAQLMVNSTPNKGTYIQLVIKFPDNP